MKNRSIYITEYDMERLRKLIEDEKRFNKRNIEHLQELEAELDRGQLIASKDVPGDVITMNSQVRLVDLDTGEEMICTLVFPGDADVDQNKISILAPVGTALLGFRVGDTIEWQVPDGLRRLEVAETLYQPEASGDYDL